MTEALTIDGARRVRVVDSHTGGEPTRVVTDGFPDLEGATLAERAADVAGRHRRLATAIVDEPRGQRGDGRVRCSRRRPTPRASPA